MTKLEEFFHYMENNKIDLVYINNLTIQKRLFNNFNNVKDVLIIHRNVYFRDQNDNCFLFYKNDIQNNYIKLFDIIQNFHISVIGILFRITSNNSLDFLFGLGDFYYFDISPFFGSLLFVKTDEELFKIQCAAILTEKILKKTLYGAVAHPYDNQYIKRKFLEECGKLGIEKTHINVSKIGISKSNIPIYSIDCGISVNGYYSDLTRMFCFQTSDVIFDEACLFLQNLQSITANIIREGMFVKDLFIALNRKYWGNPLFKNVRNGFGHGIGKQLHEGFSICSNQKWTFENGITFTLEPILNVNGVDFRIENMYALRNGKVDRINTSLTNNIIVINKKESMPTQKTKKDLYYINPEVKVFENENYKLIANLSCSSLANGKNLCFSINQRGIEILNEFKIPTSIKNVKEKYPNSIDYIDYLVSEEILI